MALVDAAKQSAVQRDVAIFLYNGVEILDFAGPGEVFAATMTDGVHPLNVFTVAASSDPIVSQGFVTITPEFTLENAPLADIIVLPGGNVGSFMGNQEVLAWVNKHREHSEIVMSVCNGAFILAETGAFDGKTVTTFWGAIDNLKESYPKATVLENTRFVDNGQIITTAGVSAGIDGALHVVSRLFGEDAAKATAKYMEYDKWHPEEGMIAKKSQK
ncbi:MAG: DJ-1/PfpI family protein [Cyclobacteriaceae bacterium]